MSDLEALIAKGESDRLDFKKTITHLDKIARTLVSFANTRGGIILVGVMDNGKINGIDPEEEKYSLQQAAQFYCDPPVKLVFKEEEHEGQTVLKVIIPESKQKPHLAKLRENDWRGYIRVKDESVQTSKIVMQALETEPNIPAYMPATKIEANLLTYFQKQPRITLHQFMHLANISKRRAQRILVHLVLHGVIRLHDKEKEVYYTLS